MSELEFREDIKNDIPKEYEPFQYRRTATILGNHAKTILKHYPNNKGLKRVAKNMLIAKKLLLKGHELKTKDLKNAMENK